MNMHYCTCQINLAGQGFHIIQILPTEPVSWPELQVLMALHGEENIFDIKPITIADTDAIAEKRRLLAKYRHSPIVDQVFPGRNSTMEMLVPGEAVDQPRADEYGAIAPNNDDEEVLGRDPPPGPAVMKPGPMRRPFPPPPALET